MSLKSCREKKGITIKVMVELLGVDRKTYYNWESKNTDIPSSKLVAIAKILDCSLNELLDFYSQTVDVCISKSDHEQLQYHLDEIQKIIQK